MLGVRHGFAGVVVVLGAEVNRSAGSVWPVVWALDAGVLDRQISPRGG